MMATREIEHRLFIVGVARSGTTLLQSMLGSHPKVYTLPETHFWDYSLYKQKALQKLQVIQKNDFKHVREFTNLLDNAIALDFPKYVYSKKKWTRLLIHIIDQLALNNDMSIWVEKTPLNLYYIPLIQSAHPDTHFIHMIRNGLDNIASLYEAGQKNPRYFAQSNIDACISRYIKEIKLSKKYLGRKNQHFVLYDGLVEKPELSLKNLCHSIGIPFEPTMLEYEATAKKVIQSEETWKNKNVRQLSKSNKKDILFDEQQKAYILSRIKNLKLSDFR